MVDAGKGSVHVVGSFDKESSPEPDFKLTLTSQITTADFNLGYLMTGTLERGHVGFFVSKVTFFMCFTNDHSW